MVCLRLISEWLGSAHQLCTLETNCNFLESEVLFASTCCLLLPACRMGNFPFLRAGRLDSRRGRQRSTALPDADRSSHELPQVRLAGASPGGTEKSTPQWGCLAPISPHLACMRHNGNAPFHCFHCASPWPKVVVRIHEATRVHGSDTDPVTHQNYLGSTHSFWRQTGNQHDGNRGRFPAFRQPAAQAQTRRAGVLAVPRKEGQMRPAEENERGTQRVLQLLFRRLRLQRAPLEAQEALPFPLDPRQPTTTPITVTIHS